MTARLTIRTFFERTKDDPDPILIQAQNNRVLIFPGKPPCVGIALNLKEAQELLAELLEWCIKKQDESLARARKRRARKKPRLVSYKRAERIARILAETWGPAEWMRGIGVVADKKRDDSYAVTVGVAMELRDNPPPQIGSHPRIVNGVPVYIEWRSLSQARRIEITESREKPARKRSRKVSKRPANSSAPSAPITSPYRLQSTPPETPLGGGDGD